MLRFLTLTLAPFLRHRSTTLLKQVEMPKQQGRVKSSAQRKCNYTDRQSQRAFILQLHKLNPSWKASDITRFVFNSERPPQCKRRSFERSVQRAIQRGTVKDKPRSGAPRRARTQANITRITRKIKNKKCVSIRDAADMFKGTVSQTSVFRVIKEDLKLHWFKTRKQQRLTSEHKARRNVLAIKLRKKYIATKRHQNYIWDRLINTDFSEMIRLVRNHHSKNT